MKDGILHNVSHIHLVHKGNQIQESGWIGQHIPETACLDLNHVFRSFFLAAGKRILLSISDTRENSDEAKDRWADHQQNAGNLLDHAQPETRRLLFQNSHVNILPGLKQGLPP